MPMSDPLLFAVKLDSFRRLKRWTIADMAVKIGVSHDRMEKLLEGQHEPRAGDIVRAERALEIYFDGEDFVEVSK